MAALVRDERALSESAGVAILITMTVVVTATVGLNVLVASQEDVDSSTASFDYDHIEENSVLIVTYVEGEEFPAGDVVLEGSSAEVTWAEAAGRNESEAIGPGQSIQLSRGSAYGSPVSPSSTIRIYRVSGENRTRIGEWPEPEADAAETDTDANARVGGQPLMLQTGNVRATLSPIPRASETRTTSSTSL